MTSSRRVSANSLVTTGVRPGGSSSMVLTSRSANSVIASVRGIGVALIISRCGSSACSASFARSASRCATPKRCCSSMIARPRRAKRTCSSITACVPTTSAGLARRDLREHLVARLALAAAGQPGDRDAERREPADELLQVLLGEDLGRRHQRALPAGVDRARRGERRDHRSCRSRRRPAAGGASARARPRSASISAATRRCAAVSVNGSAAQQRLVQAAARGGERRRALPLALALGQQLRELLRQQLVELEALPGRMRCGPRAPRRRGRAPARAGGRAPRARSAGRPERCRRAGARRGRRGRGRRRPPCAGTPATAAPCSGRPASARSAAASPAVTTLKLGWTISRPKKPPRASPRTRTRRPAASVFCCDGIEVEEAQHQVAAVVGDLDDELAARPELDPRIGDDAFDLAGLAVAQRGDRHDARLVLVAQRQVQREVDVAHQAELGERLVGDRVTAAAAVARARRSRGRTEEAMGEFCPSMTPPLALSDFDFALPPELIAQHPAAERSASRLLDGRAAPPRDRRFRDLPGAAARRRPARRQRHRGDQGAPVRRQGERRRGRGAGRARRGRPRRLSPSCARASRRRRAATIRFAGAFDAEVLGRTGRDDSLFRLRFPADPFALLERHGHVPLPPYIARADDGRRRRALPDRVRRAAGRRRRADRGAALRRRAARRARRARRRARAVTLHVGAGTFQPVRSERPRRARDAQRALRGRRGDGRGDRARAARGGRIVAVGTTSLRALESAALRGAAVALAPAARRDRSLHHAGLRFRVVDLLLTNFHLPKSTLLMLVAAFAGHERIRALYAHAIAERYRFFSYGDAMLLARRRRGGAVIERRWPLMLRSAWPSASASAAAPAPSRTPPALRDARHLRRLPARRPGRPRGLVRRAARRRGERPALPAPRARSRAGPLLARRHGQLGAGPRPPAAVRAAAAGRPRRATRDEGPRRQARPPARPRARRRRPRLRRRGRTHPAHAGHAAARARNDHRWLAGRRRASAQGARLRRARPAVRQRRLEQRRLSRRRRRAADAVSRGRRRRGRAPPSTKPSSAAPASRCSRSSPTRPACATRSRSPGSRPACCCRARTRSTTATKTRRPKSSTCCAPARTTAGRIASARARSRAATKAASTAPRPKRRRCSGRRTPRRCRCSRCRPARTTPSPASSSSPGTATAPAAIASSASRSTRKAGRAPSPGSGSTAGRHAPAAIRSARRPASSIDGAGRLLIVEDRNRTLLMLTREAPAASAATIR